MALKKRRTMQKMSHFCSEKGLLALSVDTRGGSADKRLHRYHVWTLACHHAERDVVCVCVKQKLPWLKKGLSV